MSVVIRMKRSGRLNRPSYRISVADARSPRDGRTIESLGFYEPIAPSKDRQLSLDVERARYWVEHGAQPSETVRSILKRAGVYGEPKPKVKRDRSGRKRKTQTKLARAARNKRIAEAKAARPKLPRKPSDKDAKKKQG
jgi:small subunit ribosomal protein S16